MAGESFGSTRTSVPIALSTSSHSVRGYGNDQKKTRVRRSWKRDQAQSIGSVEFPPYAAYTTSVLVGPAQCYASTLQQPTPSDPQHKYHQRAHGSGSGQRHQSSSQVHRQGQRMLTKLVLTLRELTGGPRRFRPSGAQFVKIGPSQHVVETLELREDLQGVEHEFGLVESRYRLGIAFIEMKRLNVVAPSPRGDVSP
ncbi:hypothetical protein Syun_027521 [Stephania yunnanensis]|uniref:Uncharacterized protein n=1 Tax=Stephania yunnanensis TaxID=152371 RepID=A0AAP0HRC0_9MAGN